MIKVSGGIIYKVSGEPIGEGGGSIIYPALRMLPDQDGYKTSRIKYAVKECYPQSGKFNFTRDGQGTVRPDADDPAAEAYLKKAKEMQEHEETASGEVYTKGFRLTPVLEAYHEEEISFDDGATYTSAGNLLSVMESLSGKGSSLRHCLAERKHLQAREAFDVIRQVLLAVGEVHKNGFLHLDIQDGNVFIKGVLDVNDSMISLIDFGSARGMLDDGKCAEIADRVLYSTQGFTAPEILEKNDGHLRLGKEADIYSIGALALLLLTGHRYTTREMTANTSRKYIPRFAVRKTGCPAHLIDKMQGIIARALNHDPTERYHTCEQMLGDVDEMLALLAPHTDPLSATQYDAFICYKHSERDSAAARALRDSLERYKDSFRSKRKINKVFLDEGEFSSCSDFGERINTALRNSQWLIVLCSKQTKESAWVNDEIKTFLKYHDKSRLLAVITEGEPDEVYPKELVRSGFTAKTLFAADAREEDEKGIIKKIKGDVRLQIAAPILHTTFDALKQRDRLYQMRKAFAATAAILGILAVFLSYAAIKGHQIAHQERQIVKEQRAKIDSQAALLASQAQEAYGAQDYPDAMRLALSSLELSDQDEEQRSRLKSILISCLNLYVRPEEAEVLAIPTGVIRGGEHGAVKEFLLNSDGSRLFVLSDKGVAVWDPETRTKVSEHQSDTAVLESCLLDDTYILCTEDALIAYACESGKELWKKEIENGTYMTEKLLLSEDHRHLYRAAYSYADKAAVIEDIDPATGDVLAAHSFAGNYQSAFGYACAISPDGRYAACIGTTGDVSQINEALYVFDLQEDTAAVKTFDAVDPWGSDQTTNILMTDDGHAILSRYDGPANVRSHLDDEHDADLVGVKTFSIKCCDLESMDVLWEKDTSEQSKDLKSLLIPQVLDAQMGDTDVLAAGFGNSLWVMDKESGDVISTMAFDAGIISLTQAQDGYRIILENGSLILLPEGFETDNVRQIQAFPSGTQTACVNGQAFYVQTQSDPDTLIRYEINQYDESYTEEFVKGATPADYVKGLGDDSIPEKDGVSLKISDDKTGFEIISQEKTTVSVGEEIRIVSFVPYTDRIFVGLSDRVLLYSCDGEELAEAELPEKLYSIDMSARLFFLPDSSCYYGDMSAGFLIDINKGGLSPVKYMKYVAGYDHESNEFIICNPLADEKGGATAGRIKYHSLKEIKKRAAQTVK